MLSKKYSLNIQDNKNKLIVKIILQHNHLTNEELNTVQNALNAVYQRFITKCLVHQALRDLIKEDINVTIKLFDDRPQFEKDKRDRINQNMRNDVQFNPLSFFLNQDKAKKWRSNEYRDLKMTDGYCKYNSLYHSIIRLPVAEDWITCMQHEFGHSLTSPILNLPSFSSNGLYDTYAIFAEGFAESLANDSCGTRHELDMMQLTEKDYALQSICNLANPTLKKHDPEKWNDIAPRWPYVMGHLLINYWLDHYNPKFADIVLAIHKLDEKKTKSLLVKFVTEKQTDFQGWVKSFGDPSQLPVQPKDDHKNPLENTQQFFEEVITDSDQAYVFLKKHGLNSFSAFQNKISTIIAPEVQHILALNNAIENIQMSAFRIFEKNEWITIDRLLVATEKERTYFNNFTHSLNHLKKNYSKANAILITYQSQLELPTLDTAISLINYYYANKRMRNKLSIVRACEILSSFFHVLTDDTICDTILKKKIILKAAIRHKVHQDETLLDHPFPCSIEDIDLRMASTSIQSNRG